MRKINSIIIHCTATQEGRDVTVEQIREMHVKQNHWIDIGYHYVIYRDGTIKEGRPLEKAGAHVKNHNAHSIGVCYVGGLTKDGKHSKDTRTIEQKIALFQLVYDLMGRFCLNLEQVHCHNEYANKDCPCFSISQFRHEYLNWINHVNDK